MPRIDCLGHVLAPQHLHALLARYATVEEFLVARVQQTAGAGQVDLVLSEAEAALEQFVVDTLSPPVITCQQLCDHLTIVQILPTGCEGFDALLGGGATQGCVLELAGESATGKTQACLSMAALTASRGEGVIYIDATNAFSARRLVQLGVEGHVCPDVDTMLQAVHVYRTHSLQHLLSTLDAVLLQLRTAQAARTAVMEQHAQAVLAFQAAATANPQGVQGPPPPPPPLPSKPSLLILDSISALGGSVMGERRHAQGMALLMCVGRQLRQLADAFGLAVVVTNHLVADRSAERLGGKDGGPAVDVSSTAQPMVPAMGEWWKGQVHARLQLRLGPSGALGEPKIATLTLHQDMPSHGYVHYQITARGLVTVPDPVFAMS